MTTIDVGRDHALQTYERMAPFYDAFTAHHDYELWLGNLLAELHARGLPPSGRLLDLACGTGKSFLPMLPRGWEVVGVDQSSGMLEEARSKAPRRVSLVRGDLRAVPELGRFDLVWCLGDAVNYLLEREELAECFAGFRRNLAPDGLGLFDVDELASYRGFFASTEEVERDGLRLIWRGTTPADAGPGVRATAELSVLDDGGHTLCSMAHRQRHHGASAIAACLRAAGLELLACFGHGTDAVLEQPLDELRHTKAVYIVRTEERR